MPPWESRDDHRLPINVARFQKWRQQKWPVTLGMRGCAIEGPGGVGGFCRVWRLGWIVTCPLPPACCTVCCVVVRQGEEA